MSLSEEMVDVLTYIEQCFWEDNNAIPTNEKVSEVTGVSLSTIRSYWENPDFRAALNARGVSFSNTSDSKALTFHQLMVANMLMSTGDPRSLREKLKSIDGVTITPQQVQTWMRQPAFQEHLRKRGEALYEGADHSAYKALVMAMERGDMKAVQLFFEMKGIYNPRVNVEVNVHSVLARVVEIIQINVKDPVTLQNIADGIDSILMGNVPAQLNAAPINVRL